MSIADDRKGDPRRQRSLLDDKKERSRGGVRQGFGGFTVITWSRAMTYDTIAQDQSILERLRR